MNSYKNITDENFVRIYYPEISQIYVKVLRTKVDIKINKEFKDISLSTAATIMSYARVFLSKAKLDILNKRGSIYYTSTNSIITDKPLGKKLIGNKLGQFKLKCKVKEGYFLLPKTYCLLLKNNSTIIKAKDVNNNLLSLKDFRDVYKSIHIKESNVVLNYNTYRKREKIYK
jgi:hypothetical protein